MSGSRTSDSDGPLTPELAKTLVANSIDVLFHTVDGLLQWISPSVTELLGWNVDDLVGGTTTHLWHPDDLHLAIALRDATYGGQPGRATLRFRRNDGTYTWIETSLRPYPEPDGRAGAVGSLRDVSARVVAEQKLRASELHFRLMANNASDIVYFAGPDRLIQWVSAAVTETLGWTPEELVGTRMSAILHPDDREAQRQVREVLYSGETIETPDEEHVVRVRTKGGDYHWLSGRSHVVTDESGEFIGVVTGMRNVDSLIHARTEALESSERFRLLAENISEVVVRTRDGVVLWVSPSISRVLGWSTDNFIGSRVTELIYPDDRDQFEAVLLSKAGEETQLTDRLWITRLRVHHANGELRWAEIRTSHFVDSHGNHDGGISSFHLIDEQIMVEQELQRRATHDHLTGMLNRDELMVRLRTADATQRTPGKLKAVIFCDIDHFKTINDTDGHQVGDAVLVHVARQIRSALRSSDLIARMGGDEFVIILEGIHSLDEAEAIAQKVRHAAEQPVMTTAGNISSSVSIGVTIRVPGEDVDSMIARADLALYEAKRSGRNRVVAVPAP